jgi:hypothetical protein
MGCENSTQNLKNTLDICIVHISTFFFSQDAKIYIPPPPPQKNNTLDIVNSMENKENKSFL